MREGGWGVGLWLAEAMIIALDEILKSAAVRDRDVSGVDQFNQPVTDKMMERAADGFQRDPEVVANIGPCHRDEADRFLVAAHLKQEIGDPLI